MYVLVFKSPIIKWSMSSRFWHHQHQISVSLHLKVTVGANGNPDFTVVDAEVGKSVLGDPDLPGNLRFDDSNEAGLIVPNNRAEVHRQLETYRYR